MRGGSEMSCLSEIGERTRPRVRLEAPRFQHIGSGFRHGGFGLVCTTQIFREGAKNRTRGACAPRSASESGTIWLRLHWGQSRQRLLAHLPCPS
jgi:hypothetical protein